jgi:hypothetical protein
VPFGGCSSIDRVSPHCNNNNGSFLHKNVVHEYLINK